MAKTLPKWARVRQLIDGSYVAEIRVGSSLGCDIGGLAEEVVGSNRRIVGFTFKNHIHVDKSQFLKEHWPIGVPKASSPAGKLIRKSAPVLDVHAFLEDTLGLKPFFEFKNGGFLMRRISFGIYGDTVVVAIPAEMKVTPKHRKWIKRITDIEFEKISGDKKCTKKHT